MCRYKFNLWKRLRIGEAFKTCNAVCFAWTVVDAVQIGKSSNSVP
jgi:hypothetical protein